VDGNNSTVLSRILEKGNVRSIHEGLEIGNERLKNRLKTGLLCAGWCLAYERTPVSIDVEIIKFTKKKNDAKKRLVFFIYI
jgi:hypothetical protein